jgi:hypothetical protein
MALLKSSSDIMSPSPAWSSGEPWVLPIPRQRSNSASSTSISHLTRRAEPRVVRYLAKTCETKTRRAQTGQYEYIKKPKERKKKIEQRCARSKLNEKNNHSWSKRSTPAFVYYISGNTLYLSYLSAEREDEVCVLATNGMLARSKARVATV